MNLDWAIILDVFRIIFTLIIMLFASYQDIKTRTIKNEFWIFFGLIAISLLEIQIIIEFGFDAYEYLIVIVPLLILFMSFLICDHIYDRNKKKFNEPWLFLIAVAGFVFVYLAFDKDLTNLKIIFPIILYLLFFILIQYLLAYLYHRAFEKYKAVVKKTAKTSKKTNKEDISYAYDEQEKNGEIFEQRLSWSLFFGTLGMILIIFIMSEIIMMQELRIFGLFLLVAIPIILIILSINYKRQIKTDKNIDIDNDFSADEPRFVPPNRLLILFSFYGLIILGFVVIIYYSMLDQLSNILVQIFIIMVWIILFYGFYNIGVPKGGADTKALMALAIVFPIYPILQNITISTTFFKFIDMFPVTEFIFPFALTVLINSAFVMLFLIIILLIYNSIKHDIQFPHALLGYKLPIDKVNTSFVWLMERIEEGKPKIIAFPKDEIDVDKELKLLKKYGKTRVWVTPQIPFIVPMTIGLVAGAIVGNIIFLIIGFFS